MRSLTQVFLTACFALIVSVFPAFSQASSSTAELRGLVTDAAGAAVPNATVTLTDTGKGTSRTATTDDEGNYIFLAVPPSDYELKVEAAGRGFAASSTRVTLTVGQRSDFPVQLSVTGVTESVNVVAGAEVVETDRTQQSSVINAQQITNLPISRRNYLDYALLTPGVTDSDNIAELFGQAHNNYRACAGTKPYNLRDDSPDGTGKNDGAFFWQSSVRSADLRDGTTHTALFSERCLGDSSRPDPKGDYYLTDSSLETCGRAGPLATPRLTNKVEWSGERWSDGNVCYTRYGHAFTPNKNSCLLGGSEDYDGQILVTASSRHPGGVNVQLADGSGRFVKDSVDPKVWTALGSVAGGEVIGGDY